MLFKTDIQRKIRSGEVTLAYRRLKKPSVKPDGTHKSGFGLIAIGKVQKTTDRSVTNADAQRAGYLDRKALLQDLSNLEGDLYRIEVSHAGEDPRIALRENDQLSDDAFDEVRKRLKRLDKASRMGEWTVRVLNIIKENPNRRAGDLAGMLDYDKQWFKLNVRKLKNLGLTISGEVGYTLSPRGENVLKRIEKVDTQ